MRRRSAPKHMLVTHVALRGLTNPPVSSVLIKLKSCKDIADLAARAA